MGSFIGLILGVVLCQILVRTPLFKLAPEIYKISKLPVETRWEDVLIIISVSLVICFVSTLVPAIRGSRLKPVEGLRFE